MANTKNPNFKKGHKKIGGKIKGTPNKKTLILTTFAEYIITSGMSKFETEINKLTGRDYINAFLDLFEYVKPKLQRSEIKAEINPNQEITLFLGEPKNE